MRWLKRGAITVVLVAMLSALEIWRVVHLSAFYATQSPSGEYTLEDVWVYSPLAPSMQLGFLRVIDRRKGVVYRSPLLRHEQLEMHVYENAEFVGVFDLLLSKANLDFDIKVNDWCSSWLNFFVSNTPYVFSGDGSCKY